MWGAVHEFNRRNVRTSASSREYFEEGDVNVTTMDAAAARRFHPRLSLAVLLGVASISLAGCESGSSLFGGGFPGSSIFGGNNDSVAEQNTPPPPVAQAQPMARITLAPVIGAPDTVAKQIQQDFTSAVQLQRVSVVSKEERSDYTLRGYLVAAKEKSSTKVSYIWDVTDSTGKRVNRVTGEEVLTGNASKDPWAAVTPAVAQSLASKAATSFVSWVQTHNAGTPVASNTPSPSGVGVVTPAAESKKRQVANVPNASQPKADKTETASIPTGAITALVPRVTGAPGDGSQALSAAIRQELTGRGITLSETANGGTYRVEGTVKMGEAKDGKQPIVIEWLVRDPKGKKLGTVSQRNEIPAGSLDGEWGSTAQQAAGAAVQGIVKLLPAQKTAVN